MKGINLGYADDHVLVGKITKDGNIFLANKYVDSRENLKIPSDNCNDEQSTD